MFFLRYFGYIFCFSLNRIYSENFIFYFLGWCWGLGFEMVFCLIMILEDVGGKFRDGVLCLDFLKIRELVYF